MTIPRLTPDPAGAARGRALGNVVRRRRRGLAGFGADMAQTHDFAIGGALVVGSFPVRSSPITFRARARVTGASPTGLLFEYGNATTAIAAWFNGTTLNLRAGNTGADAALATWTPAGGFANGRVLELGFLAFPGRGIVRIFERGREVARAVAANATFPLGWAADSAGAYAAAASGALPADVTATGAPSNFVATSILKAYVGQTPGVFA